MHKITRWFNPTDERGQVLVLSAMIVTLLLGMVGLIVDGGFYYGQRRQAQNSADEAARAAAYELAFGGDESDAIAAAYAYAAANGFDVNGEESVTVNIPPVSGPNAGDSNYIEVIVGETPRTFFIHVILGSASEVSARAVAGTASGSPESNALPAQLDACVLRDDDDEEEQGGDAPTPNGSSGGTGSAGSQTVQTASDSGDGPSNDGTTVSGSSADDLSGPVVTASDSGDGASNDGTTVSGASADDDSGPSATPDQWTGSGTIPTASDSGDGVSNDGTTVSGSSADDMSASADAYDCIVLVE